MSNIDASSMRVLHGKSACSDLKFEVEEWCIDSELLGGGDDEFVRARL